MLMLLKRFLATVLGSVVVTVAGFTLVALPATADPGMNGCADVPFFLCHLLPIAPDLDHDIDLTKPEIGDAPANMPELPAVHQP